MYNYTYLQYCIIYNKIYNMYNIYARKREEDNDFANVAKC